MVAALMTLLLVVAALAVDIGMQRVARRDMQALADVVALDIARELRGRTLADVVAPSPAGAPALRSALRTSLERNEDTLGAAPEVEIQIGSHVPGVGFQPFTDWTDPASGSFAYDAAHADAVPDAVRVRAGTTVQYSFAPGDGGARRAALAVKTDPSACFKIGTFLAGVDSGSSWLLAPVLGDLLGGSVDLTAVGYQGLADAEVSLLDMLVALGLSAGDLDRLLSTELDALGLLQLTADALEARGDLAGVGLDAGATAALGVLDTLVTAVVAGGVDVAVPTGQRITVGDLVQVATGAGGAALTTGLNVFDLVTAGLLVSGGTGFVDLDLAAPVPGLVDPTVRLSMITPPRPGCGVPAGGTAAAATATSSAVALEVGADLEALGSLDLNLLDIVRLRGRADPLSLDIGVAEARATLHGVRCGSPDSLQLAVEGGAVTVSGHLGLELSGSVGLGTLLDGLGLTALLDRLLLGLVGGLLGLGDVNVTVGAEVDLTLARAPLTGGTTYDVEVPSEPGREIAVPIRSDGLNLSSLRIEPTVAVSVTSGRLNAADRAAVTADLQAELAPLLTSLVRTALGPVDALVNDVLAPMLGLEVFGIDAYGIPTPSCEGLALRG